MCYIANITDVSITLISKTKLDKIIFSNQLEVDGYDLVKLDRDKTREVVVLLVTLKV